MKIKWIFAIMLLSLMFTGQLLAGSVYFWTDENGVRHYSNTGIPDEVREADVRPEEVSPTPSAEQSSTDDADTNKDATPNEPSEGEPDEAGGGTPGSAGEEDDERLAEKVGQERARLEAEIKRIKGRAMSKTFTQGMRDAQLRPLEEQLALLNADPKRYFRMKRQGAFNSADSGPTGNSPPTAEAGPGRFSSGQPRSSSGGQGDVETVAPKDEKEQWSNEEASAEENRTRKSKHSGGASRTLFPED